MTDITAHERVVVHRPADAVWRILADYARDPQWRDAVLAMVPDPAGTVVVGTTTAETLRLGGRTQHNDGLVTEVDDGRRFAWRTTSGTPAHGAREVTDLGGGRTRVDLHLTVTRRGVERVLRPILVPLVRRTLRGDAERLRVLAESTRAQVRAPAATTSRARRR
jgi:uncharacterized membrane protein